MDALQEAIEEAEAALDAIERAKRIQSKRRSRNRPWRQKNA